MNTAIGKAASLGGLQATLAQLLLPPAAFYAVGYLIIYAYVTATGLQASFWFTEAFYREAGASFLLDVLMAVALLPHVFLVLAALLVSLYPDGSHDGRRVQLGGLHFTLRMPIGQAWRRRAFFALLALCVLYIGFMLKPCNSSLCDPPPWLTTGRWLLGDEAMQRILRDNRPLSQVALYLAVAIPTLVTLGLVTARALLPDGTDTPSTPHPASPLLALSLASAFAALAVFVPLGYGMRFHDYLTAQVVDRERCKSPGSQPGATVMECVLLGRFDKHYVLVGRQAQQAAALDATPAPALSAPRIFIHLVDKLEVFTVVAYERKPLRWMGYEEGFADGNR